MKKKMMIKRHPQIAQIYTDLGSTRLSALVLSHVPCAADSVPSFRTALPFIGVNPCRSAVKSLTFPVLTCLLLAGCAAGPNYQGPPPTDAPRNFKNADATNGQWKVAEPRDTVTRARWWEVFHDPALDRLETEAMGANQDMRLAIDRIREARAQVRVAAADFYPGINLEPSAMRERSSNTDPSQRGELLGNNPFAGLPGASGGPLILNTQPLTRTFDLFRAPADLNWELDLFGRVKRNKEAARASLEANRADFENALLSVTANVASSYYRLRALDSEIAVLEDTIKTRKEALQIARERLDAGLTGELDVVRASADLAGNEADLLGIQRTRGEVENAIATLLGRPASNFRLAANPALALVPQIPAGVPSRLLERRPDVAGAERQLAAANARIGVAKAAFFPQIRLTGAAGLESADIGMLFNWQSRVWQLGPSLTLPVFEGGRNKANLHAAQARYDEQLDSYRKQVLVAFEEVETALVDIRTLSAQADAQQRAVAAGRRALELSQQQYLKGAVNFLDVLDAERTLLSNERISAQLLGQRLQAVAQLIKALGGRWAD
jgi:multidrug efflux system outer membrane protein